MVKSPAVLVRTMETSRESRRSPGMGHGSRRLTGNPVPKVTNDRRTVAKRLSAGAGGCPAARPFQARHGSPIRIRAAFRSGSTHAPARGRSVLRGTELAERKDYPSSKHDPAGVSRCQDRGGGSLPESTLQPAGWSIERASNPPPDASLRPPVSWSPAFHFARQTYHQ